MELSKVKVLSPLSFIPFNYFISGNKDDDNNNQNDNNFFNSGVICDKSAVF